MWTFPRGSEHRGRPLDLRLMGSQRSDHTRARMEAGTAAPLSCRIADRAYDGAVFRAGWVPRGLSTRVRPRDPRTGDNARAQRV